jgi:hypothetical protein
MYGGARSPRIWCTADPQVRAGPPGPAARVTRVSVVRPPVAEDVLLTVLTGEQCDATIAPTRRLRWRIQHVVDPYCVTGPQFALALLDPGGPRDTERGQRSRPVRNNGFQPKPLGFVFSNNDIEASTGRHDVLKVSASQAYNF